MNEPTNLNTPAARLKWLITFGGPNRVLSTQRVLAEYLGVTPAQMSYMVKGVRTVTPDHAQRIGEYFRVSPAWVLWGQEPVSVLPVAPSDATGDYSPSLGSVPSDPDTPVDYRERGLINLFRSVPEHKRAEILRVVSVMTTVSDSIQEGAQ